ncbi:MAG: hypothetical protein HOE80_00765 [Candidatus Magasanikbacteria bacterium]|nr:hypothetical protein [Candidatus Magasanikbacteria bacterium]MBT4071238.1 hypothetical protein [Candidatus Magasanikbacteria bacterium]
MRDIKHCNIYLKRLQFFLDILKNPEQHIPHYIHVTGTSGKGSITNMLHQILLESGKIVASNVSPHPTSIEERWRLGDKTMSKQEFADIIDAVIKPALDTYIRTSPYDMISFFEIMTAIGLFWFAKHNAQWCILEVGCGGKFDSTNIIPHKDIAIITNIGLDHIGIIGDNKKEIAIEKSGIILKNVPVFTQETDPTILDVFKNECDKQDTILHISNNDYKKTNSDISEMTFLYNEKQFTIETLGEHQINNAILCIDVAKHLGIKQEDIQIGLKKTNLPLRMEIMSKDPFVIIDGAHNPDKMKTSVKTMQEIKKLYPQANIHLLLGFSKDKNIETMLEQLSTLDPHTVSCTRNTAHAFKTVATPKYIEEKIKLSTPETKTFISLDPQLALKWSQTQMEKHDILFITGSIYLSGEIQTYLTI